MKKILCLFLILLSFVSLVSCYKDRTNLLKIKEVIITHNGQRVNGSLENGFQMDRVIDFLANDINKSKFQQLNSAAPVALVYVCDAYDNPTYDVTLHFTIPVMYDLKNITFTTLGRECDFNLDIENNNGNVIVKFKLKDICYRKYKDFNIQKLTNKGDDINE